MRMLLALTLAFLAPQEKNEAEELFRKMESRFEKAKTVRLKMAGELASVNVTLSGEFLIGEEGRMRVDLDGKVGEETMKAGMISDGKRIRLESSDKSPKILEGAEKLGRLSRLCLARGGFLGTLDSLDSETGVKSDIDELFSVSEFKLGEKGKVGERDARAVDYKLGKKGHAVTEGTVWIDLETHDPLKRTLKKNGATLSESYTGLKFDEKIDPEKFEFPKETK